MKERLSSALIEELVEVLKSKSSEAMIGAYIRHNRKLKGYTLKQLGDLCGKTISYISNIERGSRSIIRVKTFKDIVEHLDVDIGDALAVRTFAHSMQHFERDGEGKIVLGGLFLRFLPTVFDCFGINALAIDDCGEDLREVNRA